MNPVLIVSSLGFLTNCASALLKNEYLYAFLFYILTITSIWHHGLYTLYTKTFDYTAIFFVVTYGAYFFFKKPKSVVSIIIVVSLFLSKGILYFIGKVTNQMCFHPNLLQANVWHALLHILSSLGHHIILLA